MKAHIHKKRLILGFILIFSAVIVLMISLAVPKKEAKNAKKKKEKQERVIDVSKLQHIPKSLKNIIKNINKLKFLPSSGYYTLESLENTVDNIIYLPEDTDTLVIELQNTLLTSVEINDSLYPYPPPPDSKSVQVELKAIYRDESYSLKLLKKTIVTSHTKRLLTFHFVGSSGGTDYYCDKSTKIVLHGAYLGNGDNFFLGNNDLANIAAYVVDTGYNDDCLLGGCKVDTLFSSSGVDVLWGRDGNYDDLVSIGGDDISVQ